MTDDDRKEYLLFPVFICSQTGEGTWHKTPSISPKMEKENLSPRNMSIQSLINCYNTKINIYLGLHLLEFKNIILLD